jgi:hypothetical protein
LEENKNANHFGEKGGTRMQKLVLGLSLAFALIGAVRLVDPTGADGIMQSLRTAKGGADSAKTDLAKEPTSEAKSDLAKTSDDKTDLGKVNDAKTDLGGRL